MPTPITTTHYTGTVKAISTYTPDPRTLPTQTVTVTPDDGGADVEFDLKQGRRVEVGATIKYGITTGPSGNLYFDE